MTPEQINSFIDGSIMFAFFAAAMCFYRFWRRTSDRLFMLFAIAFVLMAVNRIFLAVLTPARFVPNENHVMLYAVRLLAFGVLLMAIIDKNRRRAASPSP